MLNSSLRRKWLVFPKFQFFLIVVNLGVTLVVSLILWVQMYSALSDLKPFGSLSGFQVEFFKNYLEYQARAFHTALLTGLIVGVLLSGIITLWISHRFAGPFMRLRGFFTAIAEGKETPLELTFRDGDYLSDLPPIINQAIKVLKTKYKAS